MYYIERSLDYRDDGGCRTFLGIFIALFFPFAAKGLMEYTQMPIVAAIVYWVICGIILRIAVLGKIPYFNIQFKKIWIEAIILLCVTVVASYMYIKESNFSIYDIKINQDMLLNIIIFGIISATFEQLVWVNIYDLIRGKSKTLGFIFSVAFVVLINIFFYSKFTPIPDDSLILYVLLQILLYLIPFEIYIKTKDLTLWTIARILYNTMTIIVGSFGFSLFFHL